MKRIALFFFLIFGLVQMARADGQSYCDNQGRCWYQSQDGRYLYDNKGHYLYPNDNGYATTVSMLADLGAVPAGAQPKTILAGDENQEPGYYQTDPLSNMNRELKKIPPAQKNEEPTVEERILTKISKGEALTPGEQKIYDEVIKDPQSKTANK